MTDFFVEFVDLNEGVNFRLIFGLITAYIMTLWIIVVLWVYFDARKRYENEYYPFVMGLATFFLGIPFLVFYLLIRPDKDDYEPYYPAEPSRGGVNIPMINFVGEEGVEMTLNLSVSPKIKEMKPADVKIDLNIEPSDTKFDVEQIEEVEELLDEAEEIQESVKKKTGSANMLNGLKGKLVDLKKRLADRIKQKNAIKEEFEIAKMIESKNEKVGKNKKKKKKGRK